MSILTATLLSLLYFWGNSAFVLGVNWWTVMRPLVSGFLAGVILGDPVKGAMVGAQINILYLGFIGAGGALPGDICLAGVVGTTIAITGNLPVETAMALAVPVGLLGTIIWVVKMTVNTAWVRVAEKMSAKGDARYYWIPNIVLPQLLLFLMSFIPCFLMVYFGTDYLKSAIQFLGENIVGVLTTIGGMLPAVGIALTLKSIFKGESVVFFFFGFLLVQYFGLDMISLGFSAVVFTLIYMQLKGHKLGAMGGSLFGAEGNNENKYVLLDKKTIRKSWIRWIMFNQANYNYERMQGTGFCHAMVPVINKLYPDNAGKRAELMQNHMQFFNTEPQWGACIIGLTAALEEKRAQGSEEITGDTFTSIKSGLMGPLAGIGDTIDGGVVTPLLLTLFIGITNTGNIMGVIGYIIVEALFMWTIYWQSYKLGYEKGSDAIVTIMESGLINQLILGASIMGCLVLGGLVGNYVTLGLKLMVPVGGGVMFNIQEQLFDVILPGALPLLLTLGTYKLVKKGWSSVNIIILVAAVGLAGGLLGIFA